MDRWCSRGKRNQSNFSFDFKRHTKQCVSNATIFKHNTESNNNNNNNEKQYSHGAKFESMKRIKELIVNKQLCHLLPILN